MKSLSCSDYYGYRTKWLNRSDLSVKTLKKYGVNTTTKKIKEKADNAIDGFVIVGGHGYRKKVFKYNIKKLKDLFNC